MARPKNAIPLPRLHPASGRARVTIDGRDFYLGKFGSPEADEAYRRIVAQWLAKEGPFVVHDEDPVTILELTAGYWLHAETYYGFKTKSKWFGPAVNVKQVISILNRLFGSLPAAKFGPLDLKAVMGEFVRQGWARSHVNHQVSRVKAIFKWGVGEDMIPPATWHALLAVPGLKRGKCEAYETEPVEPVSIEHVIATKKHLRPALQAMVDFCLLSGCRPNECCSLRGGEIDQSNAACWIFRPKHHKTAHHGHKRLVLIGPKAQAVIAPYLDGCEPAEFVFSPRREEERRLTER